MNQQQYRAIMAMLSWAMFTVTHGSAQALWFGIWIMDVVILAWHSWMRDLVIRRGPEWLKVRAQYKRWQLVLSFPDRQLRDDVAKAYSEFLDSAKAEIDMELNRKHKNNGKIK